jgi:glucose 1-dehydrogenase
MKAITVEPRKGGTVRLDDVSEPPPGEGSILVECVAVGVCGTDVEIAEGHYGWSPPGRSRLVLGHESLGRVLDPGPSGELQRGDLVVGIVRRPDPVPCPSCAVGEWDMCRNGRYTERGIKELDGFMRDRWRIEPEYAVKVDGSLGLLGVLLEPASVVAKAWALVAAVGRRAAGEPRTALVTGAGPIGLLAALLAKQRGLDVHVMDRVLDGPKPEIVRALPAAYHTSLDALDFEPDVVMECTGAGPVIARGLELVAAGGVVGLLGVGSAGPASRLSAAEVATRLVERNIAVVGSVNANARHWKAASEALASADASWLARLVTRREKPADFARALERTAHDVKVVVEFPARGA